MDELRGFGFPSSPLTVIPSTTIPISLSRCRTYSASNLGQSSNFRDIVTEEYRQNVSLEWLYSKGLEGLKFHAILRQS